MNRSLATILSSVFHPLLVPTYLLYVVCYQLPGVIQCPTFSDRWQAVGLVALSTFVLPSLGTAGLLWAGVVSSLELRERRQRPLPLLLAVAGFGAAAGVLGHYSPVFDALLSQMLTGMTIAVLLTLIITFWWKISAHGVGMGGAVALLALLHLGPHGRPATLSWLLALLVLAAAVAWARLAMQAHTPAQVWAGLALGAGVAWGAGLYHQAPAW